MISRTVVVGLGETLWDLLPDGPRFGGAPANFACHAAALGGSAVQAWMVSAVGADELGDRARAALGQRAVEIEAVAVDPTHPTGTVDVSLNATGVATYEFAANTAWDHLEWSNALAALAARTDAVCFGTLGQRSSGSAATIRRFVGSCPETALRVFDVNLRPPFVDDDAIRESLALANVLKLNEDELPVLAGLFGIKGPTNEQLHALRDRHDLRAVALTRGAEGAVLLQGDESSVRAGESVEVADTVGAGDAFTAAFVLGLLAERELVAIGEHAARVAAYVCSQSGGTPPIPDGLRWDRVPRR